ncbi:hypothetical protein C8R48DRAFT_677160 [Suillus tomentosus]|nr:hypothetical protein C8R48DRAFT_677160 [Suillus tomentosus]
MLLEDMVTIILEMLEIADVIAMTRTCRSMHHIGRAVVHSRFKRIICPFAMEAFNCLVNALCRTQGLITGSAARAMITGDIHQDVRDLNIVVLHANFHALAKFLKDTLSYSILSETCHPAMAGMIKMFGSYTAHSRYITLACPKRDVHVLHLILNAPSTADMVYMTTGGITQFYPQWMRQGVSIHSRTGNLVPWDNKLGCAGQFHDHLRVERGTNFIDTTCGNRCPMLWHHVSDKCLCESVDWDLAHSVTHTYHNVDIEWRLNTYCTNTACRFNIHIMASNLDVAGARNRKSGWSRALFKPKLTQCSGADVKYIPQEIRCRKPVSKDPVTMLTRLTANGTPQRYTILVKGAFYGAGCYRPFLVSIPINNGVKTKLTLDDLYVNYWVRQRDLMALTSTQWHLRRTFDRIPHADMAVDGLYTTYFEFPDNEPPINHLLHLMARMSGASTSVNGSILVVKQSLSPGYPFINMNKDDLFLANAIIHRSVIVYGPPHPELKHIPAYCTTAHSDPRYCCGPNWT